MVREQKLGFAVFEERERKERKGVVRDGLRKKTNE
jgi:hypothetical protein